MAPDPPPLLCIHIPKAAGTSLRSALARGFWRWRVAGVYQQKFLDDQSLAAAKLRPRTRIMIGHFRYGTHAEIGLAPRYTTLLRDPVARVVSLYDHMRGKRQVAESLAAQLDGRREPQFENDMTRMIAGMAFEDPDWGTPAMLVRAKANLERDFILVGSMERYPDYLRALAGVLARSPLRVRHRNRARHEKTLLTPELEALIRRANPLDLELYDWVQDRIDADTGVWRPKAG